MIYEPEILPVELVHPDQHVSVAEFVVWEFDPDNTAWIRLGLRFNGQEFVVGHEDYFHAMQKIRLELEKDDLYLNCYGASKNVFPSPMSIDMGAGHKAYRYTIGEHARISSLVSIFDAGDDVIISTVAEQEQYYRDWQMNFPNG
ncbi:MAG: hypothetical protein H0X30_22145 [Anaerolineae bacterium]|nr:hypothetical protein [Anaerolineae bacterium]